MADQQVSWAYVAGFFDGEGSIGFQLNQNGIPTAKLSMSQKEIHVLEIIQKLVGGHISKSKGSGFKGTPIYSIYISRADEIVTFLEGIAPYSLRRKQKREIALAMSKLVGTQGNYNKSGTDKLLRIEMFERAKVVGNE